MRRIRIILGSVVIVAIVAAVLGAVFVHPRATHALPPATFIPCGPWSNASSPNPGAYTDQLFGVAAISATDAWAVGWEGPFGGPDVSLAEHWNGTSWSTIASPSISNSGYSTLQAVAAISSTDVWAAGYYWDNTTNEPLTLAEHWNGTSWSVVPSQNPEPESQFYGVSATAANDVWAVGSTYNPSTNVTNTLIEHWNGSIWSVTSSPSPTGQDSLSSVVAISASDAWAAGEYSDGIPLFEHWNGSGWSTVAGASIAINGYIQGISAAGANSVWAVGYQFISNQPDAMLAEHWNGASWTLMPNYTDGSNYVHLSAVAAIPGAKQAVAVGYEYTIGGSGDQSLVLQWGGAGWGKMPMQAQSPSGNALAGVAVTPAFNLWAVGYYVPPTAKPRPALSE